MDSNGDDHRNGGHAEITPARLRELAEDVFAEANGAARGLLREHGDECVGAQSTGLGIRQLAVIRRPARRGGYSGLLILQPAIGDPSGRLLAAGSSILVDGRAVPRLAGLIADFMEAEARANGRPPASRASGIPSTTAPAVTHDAEERDTHQHQNGTR
jgi:hypothetical protein